MEAAKPSISYPQLRIFLEAFARIIHDSNTPLTWEKTGPNREPVAGTWLGGKGNPYPLDDIFVASNCQCHAYQLPEESVQLLPQRDYVLAPLDPEGGHEVRIAQALIGWLEKKQDNQAAIALRGRILAALQPQPSS